MLFSKFPLGETLLVRYFESVYGFERLCGYNTTSLAVAFLKKKKLKPTLFSKPYMKVFSQTRLQVWLPKCGSVKIWNVGVKCVKRRNKKLPDISLFSCLHYQHLTKPDSFLDHPRREEERLSVPGYY